MRSVVFQHVKGAKPLPVLLALLLLCGIAYGGARVLRQQRREYLLLCHRVEAAAAPGEPILVHGWIPALALRFMGSAALKQQLIYARGGTSPVPMLGRRELIVVAEQDDPLLQRMRANGFAVFLEMPEMPLTGSARAEGGLDIFFAVAGRARSTGVIAETIGRSSSMSSPAGWRGRR